MDNSKKRALPEQLECLLLALEKRPAMQNVRSGGPGAARNLQHWRQLAEKLNTMGASKTATKWQQAWRDWKSNTKKKAARLLEEKAKGDFKSHLQPLTDMEARLLNLVGTDLPDVKPPEIDISNILEMDPLSSDESAPDSPLPFSPDMVTVYSMKDDDVTIKTEHTPDKKADHRQSRQIKRHRIEFRPCYNSERIHKETSEMLARLTSMEESRRESEKRTSSLLERLCSAVEDNARAMQQVVTAVETQTQLMRQVSEMVEARVYGPTR